MSNRPSPKTTSKRTLAGVGALLASAVVAAACAVEQPAGGKPPSIVLDDVTLRHYAADGTIRTGHAAEVTYDRQAGRMEGDTITVDVPATAHLKRGGVHLEAARGKADLKGKGTVLSGGVTVETGAGDSGRTEKATWNAATETIDGDTPLHAEGPGYRTDADGFSFRVPDQQLQLRGNVQIHTEAKAE